MSDIIKNIKYVIDENNLIPIINIIPINNSNLNISITFPLCFKNKSYKTQNILSNNKVIITQKILQNKKMQLFFNETVLDIKDTLFNNGFILIKGDCIIEENYYELEKFDLFN